MSKNRSRNAIPETPEDWRQCQILNDGFKFKLTVGIFDSLAGFQTCDAAGIESAENLTIFQALASGAKLEAWLQRQEKVK